jgi:hypothetical protein
MRNHDIDSAIKELEAVIKYLESMHEIFLEHGDYKKSRKIEAGFIEAGKNLPIWVIEKLANSRRMK